jgi:hypothetical protein
MILVRRNEFVSAVMNVVVQQTCGTRKPVARQQRSNERGLFFRRPVERVP